MYRIKLCQRLIGACLIALLAVSCGNESRKTLPEYVTPGTSVAAVVNLDEIFRQAGLPLGKQPMLDGLQSEILSMVTFSMMNDALEPLIPCRAIDTGEILLVKTESGSHGTPSDEIIGVKVIDADAFDREVNADGYPAKAVRRGELAFISENEGAVEAFLAEADKEAPASLITVKEWLSGDRAIRTAIHAQTDVAGKDTEWALSAVGFNSEAVSFETRVLDREGNQVGIGEIFDEISTSVLGFIPPDAVIVGAFGRPAADLRILDNIFRQYTGVPASEITGTSAFSLALAGSVDNLRSAGPEAFNIQFITAADGENAGRMVAVREELSSDSRIVDGQSVARVNEGELYFGVLDGYFAQSLNRPFSSAYDNGLAPVFEGKRLAVAVNIPYGSSLMRGLGLPAGVSLDIALTADILKARLRFNGSSDPAILTLLEINRDLVEFIGAAPALLL